MNKSRVKKSILIQRQDSPEISQRLAYVPLIGISDNRLRVDSQGCNILQQECDGRVFIIAVYSHRKTIINRIYHNNNIINEQNAVSGIWITNYPRYSANKQNKCLYLHVKYANNQDCIKLHTICSLICSAIIIDVADTDTLAFLTSIHSRIIYDRREAHEKAQKEKRKHQISNLAFIKKSKNKQNIADLRRNSREISEILTEFSVDPQIGQLYNEITLLKLSNNAFEDNNYLGGVQQQIRSIAFTCQKNEDLRIGPVLKEYLEIIADSIEKKGMVDIVSSTDHIKISQGYSAYLGSISHYHQAIKKELKAEGIPNLKEILFAQRENASEQFKKHSNDAAYLVRLNQYIDQKQEKLIQENNKAHDLKNLAFLQNSSQELLGRISREKLTHEQVKPHVEAMIKDYTTRANGDNKYEILTNYLNIIYNGAAKQTKNASLNEVKSVQKELDKTRREKEELQQRILQIQRDKNSKKCCEIM